MIEAIKEGPAHKKTTFEIGKSIYEVEEIETHRLRDEHNKYLAYGSYLLQLVLIAIITLFWYREKIWEALGMKNKKVLMVTGKETSDNLAELAEQPEAVPLRPVRPLPILPAQQAHCD